MYLNKDFIYHECAGQGLVYLENYFLGRNLTDDLVPLMGINI